MIRLTDVTNTKARHLVDFLYYHCQGVYEYQRAYHRSNSQTYDLNSLILMISIDDDSTNECPVFYFEISSDYNDYPTKLLTGKFSRSSKDHKWVFKDMELSNYALTSHLIHNNLLKRVKKSEVADQDRCFKKIDDGLDILNKIINNRHRE